MLLDATFHKITFVAISIFICTRRNIYWKVSVVGRLLVCWERRSVCRNRNFMASVHSFDETEKTISKPADMRLVVGHFVDDGDRESDHGPWSDAVSDASGLVT